MSKTYVDIADKGRFFINDSISPIMGDIDNHNISWDEYFMAVAQIVKSRSKDPVTKVGACIVKDKRIISTGYNGFPIGCDDSKYPWVKVMKIQ